jgi:Ca2+-binding RTX toxin-like protein
MALTTETFTSTNTFTTFASKYTLSTTPNNLIYSGSSNFTGTGNKNANIITGNSGNDTLNGGVGADTLIGGAGNDTYVLDNASDVVTENSDEGTDIVQVAITTVGGTYTLTDNVENATLTNKVAYSLSGNALNNVLIGNAAANTLNGSAGNDTLTGAVGNDMLTGGDGNDVFIFNTTLNAKTNLDTITDFISGNDEIQLSKAIFKGLTATGDLSDVAFYVAADAVKGNDADDRVIYNTTTGALYYDADGSGKGAAVQVALIGTSSHPTLAYTDIQVIV